MEDILDRFGKSDFIHFDPSLPVETLLRFTFKSSNHGVSFDYLLQPGADPPFSGAKPAAKASAKEETKAKRSKRKYLG